MCPGGVSVIPRLWRTNSVVCSSASNCRILAVTLDGTYPSRVAARVILPSSTTARKTNKSSLFTRFTSHSLLVMLRFTFYHFTCTIGHYRILSGGDYHGAVPWRRWEDVGHRTTVMTVRNHGLYVLMVILTTVLMGSSFAISQIGLACVSPLLLAGVRFVLAGFLMVSGAIVTRRPHPRGLTNWLRLAAVGLFQTAGVMGCIFLSLFCLRQAEDPLRYRTNRRCPVSEALHGSFLRGRVITI